jgi:hypothetical protein
VGSGVSRQGDFSMSFQSNRPSILSLSWRSGRLCGKKARTKTISRKAAKAARERRENGWLGFSWRSASAEQFVRPVTFAALTGRKVLTGVFAIQSAIEHIPVLSPSWRSWRLCGKKVKTKTISRKVAKAAKESRENGWLGLFALLTARIFASRDDSREPRPLRRRYPGAFTPPCPPPPLCPPVLTLFSSVSLRLCGEILLVVGTPLRVSPVNRLCA